MNERKGIGVSPGVAIADALVIEGGRSKVLRRYIKSDQVESEISRLEAALSDACDEVSELVAKHEKDNPEVHRIIQTHLAFLRDEEIRSSIMSGVREDHFIPEYAVARVMGRYVKMFENMEDEFLAERYADLRDVEKRILRHLQGETRSDDLSGLTEACVVVARDLSPSQTATLDPQLVVGFATEAGGATSHTAIVAKSLGIPAVVGIGSFVTDVSAGDTLVIDGTEGVVLFNPDEEVLSRYTEKSETLVLDEQQAAKDSALPPVSKDGVEFTVHANIEFPWEVERVKRYHAHGIGLFRTEFLYLESVKKAAHEPAHVQSYESVLEALPGRPVTIRTLDLGSDKSPPDMEMDDEANPALGCRSLRYCFAREDLFKTQLRAVLRVSARGGVKLMFPLVSSVEEFRRGKALLHEVMDEFRRDGIPFDEDLPLGVMIEVPAAALSAQVLAKEADFFSIGSNDLIQYALAVDRVNERVASLYKPAHPAILGLIRQVVDAGREAGIEVSLCGEMAADPDLAVLLAGIGLTTFSVSPGSIPELKRVLRGASVDRARKIADEALKLATADEVVEYVRSEMRGRGR